MTRPSGAAAGKSPVDAQVQLGTVYLQTIFYPSPLTSPLSSGIIFAKRVVLTFHRTYNTLGKSGEIQGSFPRRFLEAHKREVLNITSGDSQTPEAHTQVPRRYTVHFGMGFYCVPSSMEAPPQTHLLAILHVGAFSHVLPGTRAPEFSAQETPIQQLLTS